MKKNIILSCLFMFLLSAAVSVNAESNSVVYKFGDVSAQVMPGDIISVPVYLTVSQSPVNIVRCDLSFDENVFEFQKYKSSTDKGEHKLNIGVVGVKKTNTSMIGAVLVSGDGNTTFNFSNTRLFTLRFKVKDNALPGEYSINIVNSEVVCNSVDFDEYASEEFSAEKCTVRVSVSECLKGDADCDGRITVNDAVLVLKHIAGTGEVAAVSNADTDGDGKISVNDSIVILKYIARLVKEF